MIRVYNYKLETGVVGTDDKNIANVLYNINRMETKVPVTCSDVDELDEELGELFFMIVEAKVHMGRFLEAAGGKVDTGAAESVIARLDDAMETVRDARVEEDMVKMTAAFPKAYKKLLDIVPRVIALDEKAAGRAD